MTGPAGSTGPSGPFGPTGSTGPSGPTGPSQVVESASPTTVSTADGTFTATATCSVATPNAVSGGYNITGSITGTVRLLALRQTASDQWTATVQIASNLGNTVNIVAYAYCSP